MVSNFTRKFFWEMVVCLLTFKLSFVMQEPKLPLLLPFTAQFLEGTFLFLFVLFSPETFQDRLIKLCVCLNVPPSLTCQSFVRVFIFSVGFLFQGVT